MFVEIISLVALGFGALLGLRGLFDPDWIAGVVRLQANPEKPGGYAEFRATLGGFFLFSHAAAFALVLLTGEFLSALAPLPLAAGWLGTGLGRGLSMALDRHKLGGPSLNTIWLISEVVVGLLIAAPAIRLVLITVG